ncbi:MAG: class I SAM-dependent methyltransferase [Flavobacteriaceae bacterium]
MKSYLKTKDFSVSQESFELLYDSELEMLVTHPRPKDANPYYDSEVYISHTDSKASLTDRLYQKVKQYSLKKKIQLIDSQVYKSKKLLDYGAGTGDFLAKANAKGFEGEGIEPNEKARSKATEKGIELQEDITSLKVKKYDAITLWHVLEHLPDLNKRIEEIETLLEENGTLVVAVPNYKSYDAKHYKGYWAAYDVPRHLWHFSKTSIIRLFNKHNMEVVSMRPMLFDSFYVSLLSEKYKENKLFWISAFFVGLWSNLKAIFTGEYSSMIYMIKKKN